MITMLNIKNITTELRLLAPSKNGQGKKKFNGEDQEIEQKKNNKKIKMRIME